MRISDWSSDVCSSDLPALIEDLKAARHSIHLEYFIWGADAFTEQLKAILTAKAAAGVEVRLLYDPIGSYFHLTPAQIGRASCRERLCHTCRSRWSPYH